MTGFAAYNLGCGVGMLLGSLLSRHKQAHREAFIDKSVNLTVLLMFLAYPMMCARILKLYSCRSFSEHSLLAADWSLRCGSEDVTRYQAGGAVFLILYVFGIPLLFFYACSTSRHARKSFPICRLGSSWSSSDRMLAA